MERTKNLHDLNKEKRDRDRKVKFGSLNLMQSVSIGNFHSSKPLTKPMSKQNSNLSIPRRVLFPVASINLARGESKNYRTATNFKMDYNVHGFEDLTLTANFGITANDYSSSRNVLDNSPDTWGNYGGTGVGVYSSNNSYSKISMGFPSF